MRRGEEECKEEECVDEKEELEMIIVRTGDSEGKEEERRGILTTVILIIDTILSYYCMGI